MPSDESTARADVIYLTLELLPDSNPISGRVMHHDSARVTPFSGWTGLIAGIQQQWQQAVTETGRPAPVLRALPDVESERDA